MGTLSLLNDVVFPIWLVRKLYDALSDAGLI
jgi:hypothetical protein